MYSLSITTLDCTALDLALDPARAWLHRAAHAGASAARSLGDRLDLRAADTVAWARAAQPLVLRAAAAEAALGGARPMMLWALLTDPRPYVRQLGQALGRTWVLSACAASSGADARHGRSQGAGAPA